MPALLATADAPPLTLPLRPSRSTSSAWSARTPDARSRPWLVREASVAYGGPKDGQPQATDAPKDGQPQATQHAKRFRVRTHGIEKDGSKGDLIVEVEVTVPEKLTPEQEEAMRAFAEAMKTS